MMPRKVPLYLAADSLAMLLENLALSSIGLSAGSAHLSLHFHIMHALFFARANVHELGNLIGICGTGRGDVVGNMFGNSGFCNPELIFSVTLISLLAPHLSFEE